MSRLLLCLSALCLCCCIQAQEFSRKDSLRGGTRIERTCYDVFYYDLQISVNIPDQSISGSNSIYFKSLEPVEVIQVDLFQNMFIDSILWEGEKLVYDREFDAVFIRFPYILPPGNKESVSIYYHGKPVVARLPPWDGGFTWSTDKKGNPWIGVSCQGKGASLWWPVKEDLSDEPDSMQISVEVPQSLQCIANGNLRKTEKKENTTQYSWFVSYPINNYNVSVNIGKYAHYSETYNLGSISYPMDYYVLEYNLEKAREHFKDTKTILACYEKFLGPYPFPNDGFALIETPYLGMEHQSGIAYGNQYKNGYLGTNMSGLPYQFDYIIVHETGHEYWGNNVSMADIADMWIHEGFCTYSEALYIECLYGKEAAISYARHWTELVQNKDKIIGEYGVNDEPSSDMYYKGALMLHTLRSIVNNDSLWFAMLKGIQRDFRLTNVSTEAILDYMNTALGADYHYIYDQYLRKPNPPVLNYTLTPDGKEMLLQYKWDMTWPGFHMPISFRDARNNVRLIEPTTEWQEMKLDKKTARKLKWDTTHYYYIIKYE